MPSNYFIRQSAKGFIKNIIPESIAVTLLALTVVLIRTYLSDNLLTPVLRLHIGNNIITYYLSLCFNIIFAVVLISPLFYGITRYFWRITLEQTDPLTEIFYFFSSTRLYKKALVLAFVEQLFFILIPNIFYTVYSLRYFVKSEIFGEEILLIIGFLLGLDLFLDSFLAKFLIFNDKNLSVGKAVKMSFVIIRGQKRKLLSFYLSHFGWILICAALLPIVYVFPLIKVGEAIFAQCSIMKYNLRRNEDE